MDLTPVLAKYAQEALSIVLDRHEIIVLPEHIYVIPFIEGSDEYLIGLEDDRILVAATFKGNEHGGTLKLGQVRTKKWSKNFETVDTFRGADHLGKPCLQGYEVVL